MSVLFVFTALLEMGRVLTVVTLGDFQRIVIGVLEVVGDDPVESAIRGRC